MESPRTKRRRRTPIERAKRAMRLSYLVCDHFCPKNIMAPATSQSLKRPLLPSLDWSRKDDPLGLLTPPESPTTEKSPSPPFSSKGAPVSHYQLYAADNSNHPSALDELNKRHPWLRHGGCVRVEQQTSRVLYHLIKYPKQLNQGQSQIPASQQQPPPPPPQPVRKRSRYAELFEAQQEKRGEMDSAGSMEDRIINAVNENWDRITAAKTMVELSSPDLHESGEEEEEEEEEEEKEEEEEEEEEEVTDAEQEFRDAREFLILFIEAAGEMSREEMPKEYVFEGFKAVPPKG